MSEQTHNAQCSFVVGACRQQFGEPKWIGAAPGRVNLIGEHIDYNDGFVLPFALDRYTMVAATIADDRSKNEAHLYSVELDSRWTLDLERPLTPETGQWTNYIAGVIDGFQKLGYEIPPFAAVIHSLVPRGSGLSSSAALEVACATMLESMLEIKLDPFQKALLCQKAEHEFASVPCGPMDQVASVFGLTDHAMLIDCQSLSMKQIPMATNDATFLIVNSRVKHELANSEYALRKQQCQEALKLLGKQGFRQVSIDDLSSSVLKPGSVLFRRAKHVITETERTVAAAKRIETGDLAGLGDLMAASHKSMRDDYEISCKEIDTLVRIAQRIGREGGVYGSRMTGGGFGGCTLNLIDTHRLHEIGDSIQRQYVESFGIMPELFVVRPSQGAQSLNLV